MGMGHLGHFDETNRTGSTQDGLHADADGDAVPPVTVRTRQYDDAHLVRCTASACAVVVKYLSHQRSFRWPLPRVARERPAVPAGAFLLPLPALAVRLCGILQLAFRQKTEYIW